MRAARHNKTRRRRIVFALADKRGAIAWNFTAARSELSTRQCRALLAYYSPAVVNRVERRLAVV